MSGRVCDFFDGSGLHERNTQRLSPRCRSFSGNRYCMLESICVCGRNLDYVLSTKSHDIWRPLQAVSLFSRGRKPNRAHIRLGAPSVSFGLYLFALIQFCLDMPLGFGPFTDFMPKGLHTLSIVPISAAFCASREVTTGLQTAHLAAHDSRPCLAFREGDQSCSGK